MSLLSLFVGCAADRHAMVIEQKAIKKTTPSYFVATAKNRQQFFKNVKDVDLKTALDESVKKSALFAELDKATYLIDADLYSLEVPIFGLAPTVTAKINYKLYNNASKKITYIEIASAGKASYFDGLTADLRLKVAVEKAIKENFEKFITEIQK